MWLARLSLVLTIGKRDEPGNIECKVQTALGINDLDDALTLGFTSTLMALDTLGASASNVIDTSKQHAAIISMRSASTPARIES